MADATEKPKRPRAPVATVVTATLAALTFFGSIVGYAISRSEGGWEGFRVNLAMLFRPDGYVMMNTVKFTCSGQTSECERMFIALGLLPDQGAVIGSSPNERSGASATGGGINLGTQQGGIASGTQAGGMFLPSSDSGTTAQPSTQAGNPQVSPTQPGSSVVGRQATD